MTLTQLRYFVTTCKFMNMTEAAEELHVAQPSLSNSIKALEREFNMQLLFRNKRTISLTSEGAFFLEKAQALLKNADEMVEQMRDIVTKRNHIQIGLPPMIGSVLYTPVINDFRKQYPEIDIELFEQGSMATINMLKNGELDIALVVIDDAYNVEGIRVMPVMEAEVYLAVPEGDPLAEKEKVTFRDIRDRDVIMYKDGYYLRKIIEEQFLKENISPNIVLNTNQLYTTGNMVRHKIAVGFMFKDVIAQEQHLIGIPFEDPIILHIGLIWKKESYLFSDVAKFIKFVSSIPAC